MSKVLYWVATSLEDAVAFPSGAQEAAGALAGSTNLLIQLARRKK